jgi:hypothetical protein
MYLAILQFLTTVFFAVLSAILIRKLVEIEREKRERNKVETNAYVCCSSSSSSDDLDATKQVDEYRYPRVILPSDSKLRPTSREIEGNPTEDDYYVFVKERTQLSLKTSLAVSYDGTELVVVGNPSVPCDSSQPTLDTSCGSDDFVVCLNQGTPVTISDMRDNVGLIKRLEADQQFKIMPGSRIIVPAGCEVYFRNDVSRTKFLTKDTAICTLLPPLPGAVEAAGAEDAAGAGAVAINTRN